jgi:hypothetical protein
LQEAFDLRESVEEVAQSLMPDGTAYGEAAQAVWMLEDSYRRISAAIQQVTGRALEATARAKKEAMDSALNEVIDQINEEERRIKEQSEATRALFTPV